MMYKFLNEQLQGKEGFVYDLPRWDGESWQPSSWVEEKKAEETSEACGRGLHLMKVPNPMYCRYVVGFLAEGESLLGQDENKARFRKVRLIRPLLTKEIFFPKANLRYADLSSANLRYADLSSANLSSANLRYADLSSANLRYADLSSANLRYADLSFADLSSANLRSANLSSAASLENAHGIKTTFDSLDEKIRKRLGTPHC